jgi:hypothetical protein
MKYVGGRKDTIDLAIMLSFYMRGHPKLSGLAA